MAAQGYGVDITLIAAADLSAKQFRLIKVDSAGKAALCGLGEPAIGVLQNKPASGDPATIRIFGKSKVVADAAVTNGSQIKSSADGEALAASKAVTNTSDAGAASDPLIGSSVVGVALSGASNAGEVMEMLVQPRGAEATTAA